MITRSLRRRAKKAMIDVVLKDRKIKILDTFTDLVSLYTNDDPPVRINPDQTCIETARYRKMIKELSGKMEEWESNFAGDPEANSKEATTTDEL